MHQQNERKKGHKKVRREKEKIIEGDHFFHLSESALLSSLDSSSSSASSDNDVTCDRGFVPYPDCDCDAEHWRSEDTIDTWGALGLITDIDYGERGGGKRIDNKKSKQPKDRERHPVFKKFKRRTCNEW